MKIKLTMKGGIYGVQEFEPVDTSDPEVDIPEELQALLGGSEDEDQERAAWEYRTERQVFELEASFDDDTSRTFRFPESALRSDARLKELFDRVWRHARPVSRE